MTQFYAVRKLDRVADWKDIVTAKNWVPTRSAYELAHAWQGRRGFPPSIRKALDSAGPPFSSLRVRYGLVEMFVLLDTLQAPSRTDLMLYCRTSNDEPVVIAVEAKATEKFDNPIHIWVRGRASTAKRTRIRRLKFLSELVGIEFAPDSPLRYQLLHRTASAVSESLLHGASVCALIVHSFADCADNWSDFAAFTEALGIRSIQQGVLSAPVLLGPRQDITAHFLWITDQPVTPKT
jgi:hypothetical protein